MSIVFLQSAGDESAAGATSVAVAFPADVSKGNLLVACCGAGATDILASHTTDTLGNTYAQAWSLDGFGQAVAINYTFSDSSGPCTVTLDVGTDVMALAVAEFAGIRGPTNAFSSVASKGTSLNPHVGGTVLAANFGILVSVCLTTGLTLEPPPAPARTLFAINSQDGPVYSFGASFRWKGAGLAEMSWVSSGGTWYLCTAGFLADGSDPIFPNYAKFPPFGAAR